MTEQDPQQFEEHPALARLAREVSLKQGAAQGGVWMTVAAIGTQTFQFVISILMARLLLPRQFGEVAIVYSIGAFAQIFTDLGLTAAVVHVRRVTEEVLSTAFWLNVLTGVFLTLLIAALAYPISVIYGQPQLVPLMALVSLNFTLSFGSVHLALLERTFHFRRIAVVETGSSIIGIAATPIAAAMGLGVYSLVVGPLISTAVLSLFLVASVRWLPRRRIDRKSLRDLWRFSKGLVGFNAINYWSRNLDNVLLGATVTSASLGEYNRAYNLMMIPIGQTSGVLMRVVYPALARMQQDPARMGRAWTRAMSAATGSFILPLTLTMAAAAPALVAVLYGPHWSGMVGVLELLCLAAVPQIICTALGGPYRATGQTGLMAKLGLVNAISSILAILAGLNWGVTGVAVGLLVSSWLMLPVMVAPLAKIFEMSLPNLLRAVVAGWAPAFAAVAGELLIRVLASHTTAPTELLAFQLGAGGALHIGITWHSESEVSAALKTRLRRLLAHHGRIGASDAH